MRQNLGGDYFHGLKHDVHPIRDLRAINKRGHLCVLIGINTFSAAMANTTHFRYQTYVILLGQPIGDKPNSYPETGEFTLRNSH